MKRFILAALMAIGLSATPGCASMFSNKTTANVETAGFKGNYESAKNQENFHMTTTLNPDGTLKSIDVHTTASTPESAIAAALQLNTTLIQEIMPLIKQAAAMAPK